MPSEEGAEAGDHASRAKDVSKPTSTFVQLTSISVLRGSQVVTMRRQ